jgi:hypothetical protein
MLSFNRLKYPFLICQYCLSWPIIMMYACIIIYMNITFYEHFSPILTNFHKQGNSRKNTTIIFFPAAYTTIFVVNFSQKFCVIIALGCYKTIFNHIHSGIKARRSLTYVIYLPRKRLVWTSHKYFLLLDTLYTEMLNQ